MSKACLCYHPTMRLPRLLAAVGLGAGIIAACATQSSPLAQDGDPPGAGGTAGAAGTAGKAGGSGAGGGGAAGQDSGGSVGASGGDGGGGEGGEGGGSAGAAGAGGGGAGMGGGGKGGAAGQAGSSGGLPLIVNEPDGPAEFRWLNGFTDVPSARFCFLPWSGAAPLGIDTKPQPESTELLYGELLTPGFPSSFEPATQAFRPFALTGQLAALGGQGCLALVQSPPSGVRVTPLPVLPPGATTAPRSRLVVTTGCIGGAQVPDISSACGVGVDPQAGNAGMILVELSRIAPPEGQMGIQVVHGSAAMPSLAVRVLPAGSEQPKTLVGSVSPGQIAPRPPLAESVGGLFGVSQEATQYQLWDATVGAQLAAFSAGASLGESGILQEQVAAGKGLVLVVLGPRPGSPVDAAPVAPTRLRWLAAPSL
jgi:hypothetical protein